MRKLMACAALASALAACGPRGAAPADEPPVAPIQEPATPVIPMDAAAGPSGTDNMTWHFNAANSPGVGTSFARLMYSSYGSEGMALNLQCNAGVVSARLARGEQRESWPFSLQSGAVRANLVGTTEGESEVVVTATLPMSAPVLTAFGQTGELSLIDGETTIPMNAINAEERRAVANFLQACS